MAVTTTVTFHNWQLIIESANQEEPPILEGSQMGQPTDEFIRNYNAGQEWDRQSRHIRVCQVALSAWMAGWEAGRSGKPKTPTAN